MTESDDRDDSGDRDDSDDRLGYRCPSCDELVHMISVRGPDESYAIPCGCLIPHARSRSWNPDEFCFLCGWC